MHKVLLLCCGLTVGIAYGQPGSDCTAFQLCNTVIGTSYSEGEKRILLRNWNDFAGENLETLFPIDKNVQHNVISLRLDGLGCIFPSFINDSTYRQLYLNVPKSQRNYIKLSFLDAFLSDSVEQKFRSILQQDIKERLSVQAGGKLAAIKKNETGAGDIYAFRKIWNDYYLEEIKQQFAETIQKKRIKHVFFFIHGFNVPYALAQLQGNKLFQTVLTNLPSAVTQEEILFVRVFWPALSEKQFNVFDGNCDISNKRMAVYKTKLYSFATNRAYLAGNTLNSIVSSLPKDINIQVMTHSFGSVVAAAMILSPASKIKLKHQDSPFNKELLEEFDAAADLSAYRLHFFMNAAGMPGESTFAKIDHRKNSNHYFFIGHNRSDRTLLKAFIKVLPFVKFPRMKNSSSLGCNYNKEVKKVGQLFKDASLASHFTAARTSTDKEHDFFCYAQKQGFHALFNLYLQASLKNNK